MPGLHSLGQVSIITCSSRHHTAGKMDKSLKSLRIFFFFFLLAAEKPIRDPRSFLLALGKCSYGGRLGLYGGWETPRSVDRSYGIVEFKSI